MPIIVFYCESCREPLTDRKILDRIVELFAEHTADVWYERDGRRTAARRNEVREVRRRGIPQGDRHPGSDAGPDPAACRGVGLWVRLRLAGSLLPPGGTTPQNLPHTGGSTPPFPPGPPETPVEWSTACRRGGRPSTATGTPRSTPPPPISWGG